MTAPEPPELTPEELEHHAARRLSEEPEVEILRPADARAVPSQPDPART